MIVVSLVLLLLGILSTGNTRENVYGQESSRKAGQAASNIGIALSYFLLMLWILMTAITSILTFVYTTLTALCLTTADAGDEKCLDFSLFKPFSKDYSEKVLNVFVFLFIFNLVTYSLPW
jgi:hypothetical protein